jgi:hypothetical protein
MKKRKKGRCFTISAVRQALEPRAIEMEPEELAVYVRRAEQEVLPIIKKKYLGLLRSSCSRSRPRYLSLAIPISHREWDGHRQ